METISWSILEWAHSLPVLGIQTTFTAPSSQPCDGGSRCSSSLLRLFYTFLLPSHHPPTDDLGLGYFPDVRAAISLAESQCILLTRPASADL